MQRTRARFGLLLGALTLVGASAGLATGGLGLRRTGRDRLVAHPDQRARRVELAGDGRRLHGREPERHDQHHGDGERGVQGGAADQRAGRRRPRPVPVVGRRRAARPGRSRRRAGHHRGIGRVPRRPQPGAAGLFNIDGVQYGLPYNQSIVGMWYNKDLFAQAGIDEAPPATWAELLEDVQRSRTPASRRSPSAPATSGRPTSGTRT